MKILITGASGQLGNALQRRLAGHSVYAFDHEGLDITDPGAVREAVNETKVDLVINAAAYNNVDKAETDVNAAFATNDAGPHNLAKAAAGRNIPIVHISTDYVFDGRSKKPYTEEDDVNPLSVYGRSKWAGETAVRQENPKHYILRTAWIFHTYGKNFLKAMLELSKKGPLKVVDDQFSSPTYAPHLADGIAHLIETDNYGTFHMANQGAASRYQQIKEFFNQMGLKTPVTPISMEELRQAAPRPKFSALATVRLPDIQLPRWEEGIAECARAWEENHQS